MEMNEINLFNATIKERFLESKSESSRSNYLRLFSKSAELENVLNKDLFHFDETEMMQYLKKLKPRTITAARGNSLFISQYICWAIAEGLTSVNAIDYLRTNEEWLSEQVVTVSSFLSEEEIMQIEDWCNNAQDAVIFRLLFEGVNGTAMSELVNLRREHVDVHNNTLTLIDYDGSIRIHHVSPRCIGLCLDALNETEYVKLNGEAAVEEFQTEYVELVESDYVLRPTTFASNSLSVHKHTIIQRLNKMRKLFGVDDITPKSIFRSGMLRMAKDMYDDHGELTIDDYKKLATHYRIKFWWTIKDYITVSAIKEVYGEVI